MSPLDLIDRFMPLASKEVHIGMQGDEELALIAGVHEHGSAKMNIPARSFVGTGKKKGQVPIGKLVRKSLTDIALGKKRADALLQEIGSWVWTGCKRTLTGSSSPPYPRFTHAVRAARNC